MTVQKNTFRNCMCITIFIPHISFLYDLFMIDQVLEKENDLHLDDDIG